MEVISEYLRDPMKKGVYYRFVKFDLVGLKKLADELQTDHYGPEFFIMSFADTIAKYLSNHEMDEFFNCFSIDKADFQDQISNKDVPFMSENELKYDEYWDILIEIFEDRITTNPIDVFIIDYEKSNEENQSIFLELTSLKPLTLDHFCDFMSKIPHLGETFEIIKNRQTHSSRHIYRPYALSMDIWFKDESTVSVPKDLKDLLKAATNYYQSEEWRTSVTLSAIVTESILADIYEEEMKVDAPDVPLGALVEQVKKSVKIPKQIDSAIKNLNQARIAAVHRSKSPVSDRDAEIALFSATKTLIWFMNKY